MKFYYNITERVISILKGSAMPDKHVTGGARTSAPLHHLRQLYPKSCLDSLFVGYSEHLLGLRPVQQPVLYNITLSIV
jgi:hypothetical protein